ncbi:hypothetical protein [Arthrobacter sp. STN4]|uniref:hypothetical protein n=1 Tax=Arthrobacter sp. STN4 TaxID=2923276 RepID=UPI002119C9C1|nr:hypothetical protein [Arthrobacter sp. STN4]MCQ9163976.1 hypothetical protein [Arthrobacter sp. STN4]
MPLLAGAVFAGALLGACVSAGVSVFSSIQAALYPEQFGLWGMNGGQIFFMTMLGLVVGAVAGLATGAGSVVALGIDASTSSSGVLPRALTAGLGAAVVTAIYTVIAFHVLGASGLALAGLGAGFATISGLLAAFHTRRLIRRNHSTGQKQSH